MAAAASGAAAAEAKGTAAASAGEPPREAATEARPLRAIPPGWPSQLNTEECFSVPHVSVLRDKLSARYTGRGNHIQDVGSVRAQHPVPLHEPLYYFEVTVLDAGFRGAVTVGLSSARFNLSRQVGTLDESLGFRGEDGRKFGGNARGAIYGPFFSTGDVIGCGYNFLTRDVFFTKNGRSLGVAFSKVAGRLFPTVSLHSPGETVRFNFGQELFRFDLEAFRRDELAAHNARILAAPFDASLYLPLLRSYLEHSGYHDTLKALDAMQQDEKDHIQQHDYSQLRQRKELRECILRGDIDAAVQLLQRTRPSLLDSKPQVLFRLRCQSFIELARGGRVDEAVAFARAQLVPYRGKPEFDQKELQQVLGLLAYTDPTASPLRHLLDRTHREAVADLVNAAALEADGLQPGSALEQFVRHLVAAEELLLEQNQQLGPKFSLNTDM
jgi:hypothetical protein